MERRMELLEKIEATPKYSKTHTKMFWKKCLKKSLLGSVVILLFTTAFVIWYLLMPSTMLFYYCIACPMILLFIMLIDGIYQYKRCFDKYKSITTIHIFTTHISLSNILKGTLHTEHYPYENLKKIYFKEKTNKIVFERNNDFIMLDRADISYETFVFLQTLFD